MLTRCIEKGREKCDHYWPADTLPVYYGDICVTILNEAHYSDWSITEFMLRKVSYSCLSMFTYKKNKFYSRSREYILRISIFNRATQSV